MLLVAVKPLCHNFVSHFPTPACDKMADVILISSESADDSDSSVETQPTVVFTPTKRPPSPEFDRYAGRFYAKFSSSHVR